MCCFPPCGVSPLRCLASGWGSVLVWVGLIPRDDLASTGSHDCHQRTVRQPRPTRPRLATARAPACPITTPSAIRPRRARTTSRPTSNPNPRRRRCGQDQDAAGGRGVYASISRRATERQNRHEEGEKRRRKLSTAPQASSLHHSGQGLLPAAPCGLW